MYIPFALGSSGRVFFCTCARIIFDKKCSNKTEYIWHFTLNLKLKTINTT